MKTPLQHHVIRMTLAYALLIGGLPVLQSAAFITGGWTESRVLLAVFLFGPLLAAWLLHKDLVRPGAIVLLGFMSSAVVVNGLLLEQVRPPDFAAAHWIVVLRVWILALLVLNVVLAWASFRVLRDYHRTGRPHNESPGA